MWAGVVQAGKSAKAWGPNRRQQYKVGSTKCQACQFMGCAVPNANKQEDHGNNTQQGHKNGGGELQVQVGRAQRGQMQAGRQGKTSSKGYVWQGMGKAGRW